MKKITFLFFALFALAFTFNANAQCDYTLEMNDSWGDGWNGGTMDLLVNGVVVFDEATLTGGSQDTMTFTVSDGDDVTTMHSLDGSYPGEMSYRILDALGAEVGTGDPTADITTGTITAACPTCTVPSATYTVVSNCPVDDGFSISIDITDIGTASGVTISDDQGTTAMAGVTAGMYTFGSYINATDVVITLTNDDDGVCATSSATLTFSSACPPSNDECAGAIAVNCDDVISASTTDASDSGVGNAANDLWYSYSGPAQDVTASTCTLGYDTAIFVYSDCGTTLIATNDDSCGTQSSVTFTADGSSTYYIVVDGYSAFSYGDFELTIGCTDTILAPANDECMNAEALVFATASSGTTVGATQNVAEEQPTCDTFGAIADVWYTVEIIDGTSDLTLVTTPTGTSDQANVAVYSACGGLQADSLGCDDTGAAAGETLTVTGLAIGTYYVRVWSDGIAARTAQRVEGGFDIVADATLSTQNFDNGLAFTYYPNPVNDNLTLKAQKDIDNVSVYNMLGQEVLRTAPNGVNADVNMSALQAGAYFVKVTIENVTETVRVLKN